MASLKIFLNPKTWLKSAGDSMEKQSDDPFDDPDIRSMNLGQLADLPFPGIYDKARLEKMTLAKCA
ncbi:hypothetical protein J2046_000760 [Rhizobium petrolearium]|uniref:hypothetical protein n=1 Tax=Neorhizobium petrolearium TaxID=515361 RepID=UPI001AE5785D|nr:hypothetical protein [Neorhizobium petrolearium]MBP1842516.1 hypothetical protein [Neorhizobium petrolearium]